MGARDEQGDGAGYGIVQAIMAFFVSFGVGLPHGDPIGRKQAGRLEEGMGAAECIFGACVYLYVSYGEPCTRSSFVWRMELHGMKEQLGWGR